MRLDELRLVHEYRETQKRDKDERAEAAKLKREEQKLIREVELAEAEEEKFKQMLAAAQAKVTSSAGAEHEDMMQKIAMLETKLKEAQINNERVKSMAQMTRSGWVYVISNIGSFGEDIIKIGMTRRAEPDERVKELGDASVPFVFDTHAMIYSDDAPTLEAKLHKEFNDRRVNMANFRKEFFRVTLDEVKNVIDKIAPDADFYADRDAQDYHETISKRKHESDELRQLAA